MLKLAGYPPKEGFMRRIVVDRPGRLKEVELLGYTFVTDAHDNRLWEKVGTNSDGSDMIGYLMELPAQAYKGRQAKKDKLRRIHEKSFGVITWQGTMPARLHRILQQRFLRQLGIRKEAR